jgi:hypothetical protein
MPIEEFVRKAYEIAELQDIPRGSRVCVQSLRPRDVTRLRAQSYLLMGR